MSECLFGAWKRHFPILKNLRTHCELSQKVILATSVLFNLARMLEDDFNEEGSDDEVVRIMMHLRTLLLRTALQQSR